MESDKATDRDNVGRLDPEAAVGIHAQVNRILAADLIRDHAPCTSCGGLSFAKLDGRDDEIKESVLATEVFGRRSDTTAGRTRWPGSTHTGCARS